MTDVYVDALHEFHTVMGNQYIEDGDERDRSALYHLRMRLIDEEALETHGALLDGLVRINARGKWDTSEYGDLAHLAKELADLLYVTFGTAEALRIPMAEDIFEASERAAQAISMADTSDVRFVVS